jgi:hypothetical protein
MAYSYDGAATDPVGFSQALRVIDNANLTVEDKLGIKAFMEAAASPNIIELEFPYQDGEATSVADGYSGKTVTSEIGYAQDVTAYYNAASGSTAQSEAWTGLVGDGSAGAKFYPQVSGTTSSQPIKTNTGKSVVGVIPMGNFAKADYVKAMKIGMAQAAVGVFGKTVKTTSGEDKFKLHEDGTNEKLPKK